MVLFGVQQTNQRNCFLFCPSRSKFIFPYLYFVQSSERSTEFFCCTRLLAQTILFFDLDSQGFLNLFQSKDLIDRSHLFSSCQTSQDYRCKVLFLDSIICLAYDIGFYRFPFLRNLFQYQVLGVFPLSLTCQSLICSNVFTFGDR